MDEMAIPYIGYLPQDIEGADIFNFYHPADLVFIKEAYENIMADQGKPFKSRPYRFKIKNGAYITVETNWSCFINPWSKKLEFIDGKHTVLKGPNNLNIFTEPGEATETDSPAEATPGPSEEVSDSKQVIQLLFYFQEDFVFISF